MKPDLPDVVYDTQYNVGVALDDRIGRQMHRLKRYPRFYKRLRTRLRIGGLLNRVLTIGLLDWGLWLALATAAWGAIESRIRGRKTSGRS
jgi:hypothetical protein